MSKRLLGGSYEMGRSIGKGHFSVVHLARHVFTGVSVAVKVVKKSEHNDCLKNALDKEIQCMKLVKHPNVVRLFEVIDCTASIFLVLELGDGDLYDYISRWEGCGVPEKVACTLFRQILAGITYCHHRHVCHRDLKPENLIFFNRFQIVKLTDFGFSNFYVPGSKLLTSCGSLAYSAPEVLLGDAYDAEAADVWSLGVILYMLTCGRAPFQEATDTETLSMILDCNYDLPSTLSFECKRLISQILVRNSTDRINVKQINEDPWVNSFTDYDNYACFVPLSYKDIETDVHSRIISAMLGHGFGTEEDILRELQQDNLNCITATYYLLAEKMLSMNDRPLPNHILFQRFHTDRMIEPSAFSNASLETRKKVRSFTRENVPLAAHMNCIPEEDEECTDSNSKSERNVSSIAESMTKNSCSKSVHMKLNSIEQLYPALSIFDRSKRFSLPLSSNKRKYENPRCSSSNQLIGFQYDICPSPFLSPKQLPLGDNSRSSSVVSTRLSGSITPRESVVFTKNENPLSHIIKYTSNATGNSPNNCNIKTSENEAKLTFKKKFKYFCCRPC